MLASKRLSKDLAGTQDQTATFLLVDDDFVSILNMRRVLKKLNIANRTIVARDGQEALDTLTHGAPGRLPAHQPVIVLLDMNMPRMNGIEFLKAVEKVPDLQGLIIFAFENADVRGQTSAASLPNVSALISKDAPIETLSQAILSADCGALLKRASK